MNTEPDQPKARKPRHKKARQTAAKAKAAEAKGPPEAAKHPGARAPQEPALKYADPNALEIFAAAPPGLEGALLAEIIEAGFDSAAETPGGVTFTGDWRAVWRANLVLRGAGRILVRLGGFPAFHLAQLDKRARKFEFDRMIPHGSALRVQVNTNKKSKIYHAGAAAERIETALTESHGYRLSDEAALQIKVRIDNNFVEFSVDTSGESLHKRGHKTAVGKAPMRETLAALFLREMGYGADVPVLDPMCGSGTFVIEAAEWAAGLWPGRDRAFAFEGLIGFDPNEVSRLREEGRQSTKVAPPFFGSDRNAGAIENATKNALSAGVDQLTRFTQAAISDLERPDSAPGIVIVNPPYGARIGKKKDLFALYGSLGKVLAERFSGWRVGIITSDGALARATGLPFAQTSVPIPHGGLKVKLYATQPLA